MGVLIQTSGILWVLHYITFPPFHVQFIFTAVFVIHSEITKRSELEAYLAGETVGLQRIRKYIKRDKLIKGNEEAFIEGTLSVGNFLLRSRYLFDVDVIYFISCLLQKLFIISVESLKK